MISKQQRDDARLLFFSECLRVLELLRDVPLDGMGLKERMSHMADLKGCFVSLQILKDTDVDDAAGAAVRKYAAAFTGNAGDRRAKNARPAKPRLVRPDDDEPA
jgi:hypothetical protein